MWTVSDARKIKSILVILHIFFLQSGSCAGGHYSWRNQIQEGTSKHRSCAFFSFYFFLRRRRNQLKYLRAKVYVTLLLPHPQIESGLAVRLDIHRTEDASVCQNALNIFNPFLRSLSNYGGFVYFQHNSTQHLCSKFRDLP